MSNKTVSKTTANLIKARELITPPEKWIIEMRTYTRPNGVVAHCALGALDKIKDMQVTDGDLEVKLLASQIPAKIVSKMPRWLHAGWDSSKVAHYNNYSTHEEVLDLFDRTIQESIRMDHKKEQVLA